MTKTLVMIAESTRIGVAGGLATPSSSAMNRHPQRSAMMPSGTPMTAATSKRALAWHATVVPSATSPEKVVHGADSALSRQDEHAADS